MATVRVVATGRGFDGTVVREAGEEFDVDASIFDKAKVPVYDRDGGMTEKVIDPPHPWFKKKEANKSKSTEKSDDLV